MEFFAYSVLTTIGGIVLYIIIHLIVQAPGAALHKQFEKLGNLQGKSLDEIIAACGKPQSISPVEGGTLYQWISSGCHMALLFDEDNKCLGITQDTLV